MVGDPNDEGRWVHDGEKFVDGTYRIACASCTHVVFDERHVPALQRRRRARARARDAEPRSPFPSAARSATSSSCSRSRWSRRSRSTAAEPPKPKPLAEFGEPGYHVVAYACHACDNAVVAERCPLCDGRRPAPPPSVARSRAPHSSERCPTL